MRLPTAYSDLRSATSSCSASDGGTVSAGGKDANNSALAARSTSEKLFFSRDGVDDSVRSASTSSSSRSLGRKSGSGLSNQGLSQGHRAQTMIPLLPAGPTPPAPPDPCPGSAPRHVKRMMASS